MSQGDGDGEVRGSGATGGAGPQGESWSKERSRNRPEGMARPNSSADSCRFCPVSDRSSRALLSAHPYASTRSRVFPRLDSPPPGSFELEEGGLRDQRVGDPRGEQRPGIAPTETSREMSLP